MSDRRQHLRGETARSRLLTYVYIEILKSEISEITACGADPGFSPRGGPASEATSGRCCEASYLYLDSRYPWGPWKLWVFSMLKYTSPPAHSTDLVSHNFTTEVRKRMSHSRHCESDLTKNSDEDTIVDPSSYSGSSSSSFLLKCCLRVWLLWPFCYSSSI